MARLASSAFDHHWRPALRVINRSPAPALYLFRSSSRCHLNTELGRPVAPVRFEGSNASACYSSPMQRHRNIRVSAGTLDPGGGVSGDQGNRLICRESRVGG